MSDRILLFGGTFNPIHNGHLIMAMEAVDRLDYQVFFVPSAISPHKKDYISFDHRYNMIAAAIKGVEGLSINCIEAKMDGPSYTINTVREFNKHEGGKAHWLIGTDNLSELPTWHKIKELIHECKFIVAERNPYKYYDQKDWLGLCRSALDEIGGTNGIVPYHFTPLINNTIEISSSEIRHRVQYNDPINFLVPDKVREYIEEHGLYKNNS